MNTPIHHETEISGGKRRAREMLSMISTEQISRNTTNMNNVHMYNTPSTITQATERGINGP